MKWMPGTARQIFLNFDSSIHCHEDQSRLFPCIFERLNNFETGEIHYRSSLAFTHSPKSMMRQLQRTFKTAKAVRTRSVREVL